ncbi:MAG: hypothetical protein BroJett029_16090 [Alphaproteobacteria bacterium]|nr:MAG: hypothetical protein BroJett029_16090 [Alphaproteobacteria bacterium]
MTDRQQRGSRRRTFVLGAAFGLAIGSAGLLAGALSAQGEADAATGQSVTPVFSAALPNLPGNSLTVVEVEYAPGGRSTSHRHAGSVFAYVIEGEIRSQLDDGAETIYRAGESFFEPPGTRHAVSENASDTAPARLLAVIVAETGAELTTFDE